MGNRKLNDIVFGSICVIVVLLISLTITSSQHFVTLVVQSDHSTYNVGHIPSSKADVHIDDEARQWEPGELMTYVLGYAAFEDGSKIYLHTPVFRGQNEVIVFSETGVSLDRQVRLRNWWNVASLAAEQFYGRAVAWIETSQQAATPVTPPASGAASSGIVPLLDAKAFTTDLVKRSTGFDWNKANSLEKLGFITAGWVAVLALALVLILFIVLPLRYSYKRGQAKAKIVLQSITVVIKKETHFELPDIQE